MTVDAVGGVWRYAVDLITDLLARRSAEILLVTMGPRPNAAQRKELEALGGVRLVESDFALEWMPHSDRDVAAAGDWLVDLQDKFGADIVHLNGYSHAALPWECPVVVVAHSCVYSWWQAVHGSTPGPEWLPYFSATQRGLVSANAIVSPSRAIAKSLSAIYGTRPDDIQVIPNFSRVEMRSGEKERFCVAAGRFWDKGKNLQLLERIAPEVEMPIRVAGDGTAPDGSRAVATSVQLLGSLSRQDMAKQMSAAEIFLHPSLYEPFGLAVLEAAHASCALLLADIESLRELWDDAAIFLNPRDPEQWIAEIARLGRDRCETRRLGERARQHASRYTAESSVAAYWSLYDSLLSRASASKAQAEGVAV